MRPLETLVELGSNDLPRDEESAKYAARHDAQRADRATSEVRAPLAVEA